MIIDINMDFLVRHGLTPNQYLILYALQFSKTGMLRKLKKDELSDTELKMSYSILESKGFIKAKSEDAKRPGYVVTEKYTDISTGNDMFDEIIELFPTKVIRNDGSTDYLKTDKVRSRAKYRRLTRGRRDIHEYILGCLQYELKHRERTGSMQYMKKLPNWLASETWKEWGERMKEDNTLSFSDGDDIAYGTELE